MISGAEKKRTGKMQNGSNNLFEVKEVGSQEEFNTVKKIPRKFPSWRAPGADGIQGFWMEKFKSVHPQLPLTLRRRKNATMDDKG